MPGDAHILHEVDPIGSYNIFYPVRRQAIISIIAGFFFVRP